MPLDARKIARIKSNLRRITANRMQQINLTFKNADGTTTTATYNALWRPQEDQDPTFDPAGGAGDDLKAADVVAMFLLADISYSVMRTCIYAEPASGQPGPALAQRYIPTSIEVKGIIPGGDRMIVTFDRQR